jgi:hypothetical protein
MYTTCWYAGGYPLEEGLRKWAWRETMPATMAKKKPVQPDAVPAPEKKDQHKSPRMVRLPVWLHEALKRAATRHRREMTEIVRNALEKELKEMGEPIPPAEDTST